MDTRDLSSYYPGLLDDIKSIFSEETTASNQIEMLKELINDFEEESKNV